MKKKLCLLLLIVLIVPVVAFFGCGTTNYYNFSYRVSGKGNVVGSGLSSYTCSGTFSEGSRVSLTATPDDGETFLGWVFRRTILIVDGQNGYSISSTNKNGSTLSFSASANREGQYTAVFSDKVAGTNEDLVDYVKLDGFKFEKNQPVEESLFTINALDIAQGGSSNPEVQYEMIFDGGLAVQQNIIYKVDDYFQANKVMLLTSLDDMGESQKRVKATLRIGNSFVRFDDEYIKIFLREKQESDKVTYSNGTYEVRFSFTYSNEQYNLVLIYKALGNV